MNINKLLKEAQKMQEDMKEMQNKIAAMTVEGTSGGGMVTVTMNGDGHVKKVNIDPKIVDPADKEMLEDLIVAAFNDAREKLASLTESEMSKVSAGLPLPPGLKLPF